MASLSSSLSSVDVLLMRSKLPPSGHRNDGLRFARAAENDDSGADEKLHVRSVSRTTKIIAKDTLPPQAASVSSRRMSAMLKSPSVRKHIAESLGIDPDSSSVGELIRSRLDAGSRVRQSARGSNPTAKNEPVKTLDPLPVNVGVPVANAARLVATTRAESADQKRFHSVENVTAVDEPDGNGTNRLLRQTAELRESRDSQLPKPQWRRSSLVDYRAQFRLPTFDEFVRTHNKRTSRDENDVISKPSSSGNRNNPLPGLLSSFGGSFNELHRTANAVAGVRSGDVISSRGQFYDSWSSASNQFNQPTVKGASKRRERDNSKFEVGLDGAGMLFSGRRDSPRREKCQPTPVNGAVSLLVQEFPVSNGDDHQSTCSISGDNNISSRLLPETAMISATGCINSDCKQNDVKPAIRRRNKAVRDSRGKQGLTEVDGYRTSCRNKPPAHPQQSLRTPKPPSTIVAADTAQPSVGTRRQEANQRPVTSDGVRRMPDTSNLRTELGTRDVLSAASAPAKSSVQESTRPASVPQRHTPVPNGDHCTPAVNTGDGELDRCKTWTTKSDAKRSMEQIQAVREIVETEISYGNDLAVLQNEFYTPLKSNGLITVTQLDGIFLNLNQLIANNEFFMKRLQANTFCCSIALTSSSSSVRQRDTSAEHQHYASLLQTQTSMAVNIGRAFLESRHMLIAFETYCINQAAAVYLVDQLTQDRELLRIFLEELPKDRISLRKMDLKSFLMIPVQRVTKYPLLLDRLYKVTPDGNPDKHEIYLARKFIEQTLSSINSKAIGSLRTKRRGSHPLQMLLKRNVSVENVELTQFVFDVLKWTRNDTHLPLVSQLMCRSGRRRNVSSNKYHSVHCVLATLGMSSCQNSSSSISVGNGRSVELIFPSTAVDSQQTKLRQAAVVIVKEKAGKFTLLQAEPLMMDRCIVSSDSPTVESFELDEMNGETYRLKAEDPRETLQWYKRLQQLTMELGLWRRRRNALPNVMTHRRDEVT